MRPGSSVVVQYRINSTTAKRTSGQANREISASCQAATAIDAAATAANTIAAPTTTTSEMRDSSDGSGAAIESSALPQTLQK